MANIKPVLKLDDIKCESHPCSRIGQTDSRGCTLYYCTECAKERKEPYKAYFCQHCGIVLGEPKIVSKIRMLFNDFVNIQTLLDGDVILPELKANFFEMYCKCGLKIGEFYKSKS